MLAMLLWPGIFSKATGPTGNRSCKHSVLQNRPYRQPVLWPCYQATMLPSNQAMKQPNNQPTITTTRCRMFPPRISKKLSFGFPLAFDLLSFPFGSPFAFNLLSHFLQFSWCFLLFVLGCPWVFLSYSFGCPFVLCILVGCHCFLLVFLLVSFGWRFGVIWGVILWSCWGQFDVILGSCWRLFYKICRN